MRVMGRFGVFQEFDSIKVYLLKIASTHPSSVLLSFIQNLLPLYYQPPTTDSTSVLTLHTKLVDTSGTFLTFGLSSSQK